MLAQHVDSFEERDSTDASPEQAATQVPAALPSTTAVSNKALVDDSSIAAAAEDDDFAMRSITLRAFDYVQVPCLCFKRIFEVASHINHWQLSASENRSEIPGNNSLERLTELLKRHPKLMTSKVKCAYCCFLPLQQLEFSELLEDIIYCQDRHGMPIIVWAAHCRAREAMAALLNAGATATTVHNGSRYASNLCNNTTAHAMRAAC